MSNTQIAVDQTLRNEIKDALKAGVCTVVFTKSDGTERSMRCTLKQDLLPTIPPQDPQAPAAPKQQRKPRPENNLSVWDLEKGAWRSFNLSTLIKWKREH